MFDIKKKLIAIATICAMAVSMSACSDEKKDGKDNITADDIQTVSLSPEEASEMLMDSFEIVEFTDANSEIAQDPVEQEEGNASAGGNTGFEEGDSVIDEVDLQIDEVEGNNNNSADSNDAANSDGGSASNDGDNSAGNVGSDSQANDNANSNSQSGNSSDGDSSALVESTGTKKIQQAFWMNLNGDFTFDGEFITATFKIKETTADGTYPITIEWLDFANIKGVSIDDVTGVDGAVVVGGEATENSFTDGFQIKVDCVSGKAGDEVTVKFRMQNNPGICACVFRFGYDSDALEYVSGTKGSDFLNALETQNVK